MVQCLRPVNCGAGGQLLIETNVADEKLMTIAGLVGSHSYFKIYQKAG